MAVQSGPHAIALSHLCVLVGRRGIGRMTLVPRTRSVWQGALLPGRCTGAKTKPKRLDARRRTRGRRPGRPAEVAPGWRWRAPTERRPATARWRRSAGAPPAPGAAPPGSRRPSRLRKGMGVVGFQGTLDRSRRHGKTVAGLAEPHGASPEDGGRAAPEATGAGQEDRSQAVPEATRTERRASKVRHPRLRCSFSSSCQSGRVGRER